MRIEQGSSAHANATQAVTEAAASFGPGPFEILFAFCSTAQDPHETARALAERFPGTPVVGCTTAGEHLNGAHSNGALVLTALADTGIRWAVQAVDALEQFDQERATEAASRLLRDVGTSLEDADPDECFCIAFLDGLRGREEALSAVLADALSGIPVVGGSAGDDLAFTETRVFVNGEARTNAAVLVVGRGSRSFRILKHQHFTRTSRRFVVTRVDGSGRRLLELDGRPAFGVYARALGKPKEEVTADVTFLNPVTFSCDGELYVRSIQQVHADDSMTFYCGVEEGMVLELGGHHDMVEALDADFARMTTGVERFQLLLGFNCILRALESKNKGHTEALGALWRKIASHSIGFDTYGEQVDGLHINQTLVAIGLCSSNEGSQHE